MPCIVIGVKREMAIKKKIDTIFESMVVNDTQQKNVGSGKSEQRDPKNRMILRLPRITCDTVFDRVLAIVAEGAKTISAAESSRSAPLIKAESQV